MSRGAKRPASVPPAVARLGEHVSKAELLALVWRNAIQEGEKLALGFVPTEAEMVEMLIFDVQFLRASVRRRPLSQRKLEQIRGAARLGLRPVVAGSGHCGSPACDGLNDLQTPNNASDRPFCACPCAGCVGARERESGQSAANPATTLRPGGEP